jgi:hypothetical protein
VFGSVILEIAIGLSYVFLLLAVVCSAINEWLADLFALRANTLKAALRTMLDSATVDSLYAHPLVQGLTGTSRPPSYIPAHLFATALLDTVDVTDAASSWTTTAAVQARIAVLPDGRTKRVLRSLVNHAGNDVSQVRRNIESWFDHAMDRVSGSYKRQVQRVIVVLALLITVAFNVDTLAIANWLAQDTARAARVTSAAQTAAQQPAPASGSQGEAALVALQLPLGWSEGAPSTIPLPNFGSWIAKILGLLFTAVAVSMGAPFWFDFLGRLVNLREAGNPPSSAGS